LYNVLLSGKKKEFFCSKNCKLWKMFKGLRLPITDYHCVEKIWNYSMNYLRKKCVKC